MGRRRMATATTIPRTAPAGCSPRTGHLRKHFRALPYDAVQAALATVQASRDG